MNSESLGQIAEVIRQVEASDYEPGRISPHIVKAWLKVLVSAARELSAFYEREVIIDARGHPQIQPSADTPPRADRTE